MMKRATLLAAALLISTATAFAGGGGGTFVGRLLPYPELRNQDVMTSVSGGFGYGVSRDGSRVGGFGLAIEDERNEEFYGAFGGLMSGQEVKLGPVIASINLWSGVGYLAPRSIGSGSIGYYAELSGEIGALLLPWMQTSVYGGMQITGSFSRFAWFERAAYAPVAGIRFAWGSF